MNYNKVLNCFKDILYKVRITNGAYLNRIDDLVKICNIRLSDGTMKAPHICVLGAPCSGK